MFLMFPDIFCFLLILLFISLQSRPPDGASNYVDPDQVDLDDYPDDGMPSIRPSKVVHRPRPTKKAKDEPELQIMSNISDRISSMSNFITSNAATSSSGAAASATEDCIGAWSRLLAIKVRQMPDNKGEDFRFEVDTLAHNYLKDAGNN